MRRGIAHAVRPLAIAKGRSAGSTSLLFVAIVGEIVAFVSVAPLRLQFGLQAAGATVAVNEEGKAMVPLPCVFFSVIEGQSLFPSFRLAIDNLRTRKPVLVNKGIPFSAATCDQAEIARDSVFKLDPKRERLCIRVDQAIRIAAGDKDPGDKVVSGKVVAGSARS